MFEGKREREGGREIKREKERSCYVYIRVQRIEFLHFQSLHRTADNMKRKKT